MLCHSDEGDRVNSYALVSYIAGPLGTFLDRMRRELVPSCCAQSHVSILPPRSVAFPEPLIHQQLAEELQDSTPFTVELTRVEVFQSTSVIFLDIGEGRDQLKRMHDRLNRDRLASDEPHQYCPHITLAQDFPPQELPDMRRIAEDCWADFRGSRSFEVQTLTFVQNTTLNRWIDLAEFPLGDSVLAVR